MAQQQPAGPFRLVTLNTAPERAQRLIGRVVEDVKDKFTIIHAANAASIAEVRETVEEAQSNVLFTASMWTPEEAQQIVAIAKEVVPDLKTFSLPQGLQVEKGRRSRLSRSTFQGCWDRVANSDGGGGIRGNVSASVMPLLGIHDIPIVVI
ncbi:hypothetical protein VTK56DRAFT_217 [Thermocarpiscus australiensis]